MVDASILVPRVPRRAGAAWVRSTAMAAVAVAIVAVALTGLDRLGRPPQPPLLRASFIGSQVVPDVRLAPTPAVVSAVPPAPVVRRGPVDVPADPYASEEIVEIGTLEIAKLGVRQRLMQGVTLRNIDLGPSQWPGTSLPGQAGNMVVAGHRVTHSKPFRNIDQLAKGDEVSVTAGGVRATYRVVSSFVVTPDRTDIANPTVTPTLTLFACHPPGSARQRFVVQAELVTGSYL